MKLYKMKVCCIKMKSLSNKRNKKILVIDSKINQSHSMANLSPQACLRAVSHVRHLKGYM